MTRLIRCGTILVSVVVASGQVNVLTWHNDNARTGQNLQETVLNPANVKSSTFGLLGVLSVDGKVDAQPLYVSGLNIPNLGVHNVLFVATEHGSLYAFDADTFVQLRKVTLLGANEVPSDDHGCGQVTPEIGITATPAIDLHAGAAGMIYAIATSKDASQRYHHRLHALDLPSLTEQLGGPIEIQASYPGSGAENIFNPSVHKARPALLISNGVVYTSWGSHCDGFAYAGWVLSYSEATLAQVGVLNLVPNGSDGGIWAAGSGPAADANGNVFLLTGNGTFDTSLNSSGFPSKSDFGNAFVKISTSSPLSVTDYFTMVTTVSESASDIDLGSGGLMLLPPLDNGQGELVSLVVGAGKDNDIYVLDQSNLGKFNPSMDSIYQLIAGALPGGSWSSPAWFDGKLYYSGVGDNLKAFAFREGFFSLASRSANTLVYPGTTPSVSASGLSDGIVWAVESQTTAVLHAYDANNVAVELYNSNQAAGGRDQFGGGNKFIVPTVANGKVYVGTTSGVGVFGLLAGNTGGPVVPTVSSFLPQSGGGTSGVFTAVYSSTAGGGDIFATQVMMSPTGLSANSCYFGYDKNSNNFLLLNDVGNAWLPPGAPPGFGSVSNSQCTILGAGSSATISGNQLTVVYNLQFKSVFAGWKTIWTNAYSTSSGIGSPFLPVGSWSVPGTPVIPAIVSFSPQSGNASSQTFTAVYSSALGGGDILSTEVLISATGSLENSCFFGYDKDSNSFLLLNDAGNEWLTPGVPPGFGTVSNSQCAILGSGSSATIFGNQLTVAYNVQFTTSFYGLMRISTNAYSVRSGIGSPFQLVASWTVPRSTVVPTVVSFAPRSGGGSSQTFTGVYNSSLGGGDILSTQVMVSESGSSASSCYFGYDKNSNSFLLLNDAGSAWLLPGAPPGSGSVSNSQCTIFGGGSSATVSGNQLTVVYNIRFNSAFVGAKTIWTNAYSVGSGLGSAFQAVASFSVSGGTLIPTLISFSPTSGSGLSQAFTAVYSSSAGGGDILATQVMVSANGSSANSCYFGYDKNSDTFLLLNDAGSAWLLPGASSGSGSVSNSQCTILGGGSSATISGNQLTVVYNIRFNSAFVGAKTIWTNAYSASSGLGSAWQSSIAGINLTWTL